MVNGKKLMLKVIYISAFFRQEAGGINLSNIRQSGRVRKTVDYTFSEFDQEILEAVDRDSGNRRADQSSHSITATRGIRQSKRRRMLYNDSDSDSNYDPNSPMVEPQIPKHPERHVYLRRHENGVEGANSDDIEKDKQEDVLSGKTDDISASNSTALQSDEAVYDRNSLENSKLSNSAIVGASSNQYGESGSLRDAVNKLISCEDVKGSMVQNNKLSTDVIQTTDTTSHNQEVVNKESVNTNIEVNDSCTGRPFQHNNSTNIRLLIKQDTTPLNLSEDSVIQLNDNTQVHTSTTDEMSRDGNIVNGNECTRAESNCGLLNSHDINLLKQENEQPDLIQKNPNNLHEAPTFA